MSKVYKQVNFVAGASGAAFGGGGGGGGGGSVRSTRKKNNARIAEANASSTSPITENELKDCLTAGATAAIVAGAPALTGFGVVTVPAAVGIGATVTSVCLVGKAFTN